MKWTWTRIAHSGPIWRKRWDSNPRAREGYLISSQARYDHFDTLPYMLTRFREVNAIFSFIRIFIRTRHAAKLLICREPALLKALWGFGFSKKHNISSQARKTASIRFCIFCFIYAEEQRSLDCQDILAKTKASVNTKIDKETVRW